MSNAVKNEYKRESSDDLDLREYGRVILRRWRMLLVIILAITLGGAIYSMMLPDMYRAQATIMPIVSNGSGMGGIGAELSGGMAVLSGMLGGGGMSSGPQKQIMALLKSRTMAEKIIKEFNLIPILLKFEDQNAQIDDPTPGEMEGAVSVLLRKHVSFNDDKMRGLIRISANFEDPKIAAEVVDGYVRELNKKINASVLTRAKRNRIFIGKQIAQNKRELLNAGKELNEFYNLKHISSVDSKIDVPIGLMMDELPDLELGNDADVMLATATDDVNALLNKKKNVDEVLANATATGGIVKGIPQQVYLNYLTLRREMLGQLNMLLARQYEMAKINESKEELAFEMIDPAKVPAGKYSPLRKKIIMIVFIVSLFVSIFTVFLFEYFLRMFNIQGFSVTRKLRKLVPRYATGA